MKRLATVPGIGTVRAAQIVAIVMNPTRFRTSNCVSADLITARGDSSVAGGRCNEPWPWKRHQRPPHPCPLARGPLAPTSSVGGTGSASGGHLRQHPRRQLGRAPVHELPAVEHLESEAHRLVCQDRLGQGGRQVRAGPPGGPLRQVAEGRLGNRDAPQSMTRIMTRDLGRRVLCWIRVEAPGIDRCCKGPRQWSFAAAAMTQPREDATASEQGGGAGNRTRVRKASNQPSFTCVVALTQATGSVGSATTYPPLISSDLSGAPSAAPALVVDGPSIPGRSLVGPAHGY